MKKPALLGVLFLLPALLAGCHKDESQNGEQNPPPGVYGSVVNGAGEPLTGAEVHLITAQNVTVDGVEVVIPDTLCNLQGE